MKPELSISPAGITGSGIIGVGGAIVVIVLVLAWLTVVQPPFVY
jgi:hypothetical protein